MPVLTKDVRLPGSNITIPGTGRSRPEIRMPEIDLPRFEAPDIDVAKALSALDLGKLGDAPRAAGKAIAEAASDLQLRPRPRRWPRRMAAVGLIAAALAAWALTNEVLRARLAAAITSVRERAMSWLTAVRGEVDLQEPVAFTAAETEPITESPFAPDTDRGTPDYPSGLGSNNDADRPDEVVTAGTARPTAST